MAIKMLVALLVLIAAVMPILALSGSFSAARAEAIQLAIFISCDDELSGTGFPVAGDLVMTAGHVTCEKGQMTRLSFDVGKSWYAEDDVYVNSEADVAMIIMKDHVNKRVASFRDPVLGEPVVGFGLPLGGTFSSGVIAATQMEGEYPLEHGFASTTIPLSGMSGSAVVGFDQKVVGIVNFGLPDQRVGGTLSGGYKGLYLKSSLKSFEVFRKARVK